LPSLNKDGGHGSVCTLGRRGGEFDELFQNSQVITVATKQPLDGRRSEGPSVHISGTRLPRVREKHNSKATCPQYAQQVGHAFAEIQERLVQCVQTRDVAKRVREAKSLKRLHRIDVFFTIAIGAVELGSTELVRGTSARDTRSATGAQRDVTWRKLRTVT